MPQLVFPFQSDGRAIGFLLESSLYSAYDYANKLEKEMLSTQDNLASIPSTVTKDFPVEELLKHRGRWIAFSADGCRIISSDASLTVLDQKVRAAGENQEEVLLEWIPDADGIMSGSELS